MRRIHILILPFLLLLASTAQAQNTRAAKDFVKRGITRFSRGDIEGAISSYEKALEINPQQADAFFHRGRARRAKGDLNGAISDYEACAQIDPQLAENNRDIANAYFNRGFIRVNSLELIEALADLGQAIKYDPGYTEAFLKRGEAHLILGELNKAIADFDSTLELNPYQRLASLSYAGRGFAKLLLGDREAAEKDFAESIKLNSDGKFFLELHLRLLEAQMKEVKRRRAAPPERIA
jgi:tetratricopeptide (TPR) repeat protein